MLPRSMCNNIVLNCKSTEPLAAAIIDTGSGISVKSNMGKTATLLRTVAVLVK